MQTKKPNNENFENTNDKEYKKAEKIANIIVIFILLGTIAVLILCFIFGFYIGLLLLILYFIILVILSKKVKKINETMSKIPHHNEIPYRNIADWSFFGKKIEVTAVSSLDENDMLSVLYENKECKAKLFWNVFGKKAREVKQGDTLVVFLKTTTAYLKNGKEESETWFDVVRPEFADSIPIQAL
ncbi:MAG: hypothetical protein LBP54_07790 [Campylobacteraceae bacterium]|jgi:Ca2+/Na+ antiporter|nr:hypothetical protein [Campylobacteraceae bacterium]